MEIIKGSWHHRLATVYSNLSDWEIERGKINFCQYSRKVMGGAIVAMIVVILGVLIGSSWLQVGIPTFNWLFNDMAWVWYWDPTGNGTQVPFASILIAILVLQIASVCVFLVAGSIVAYNTVFPKRMDDSADQAPPGFFRTWYRSWKEKFCPIVTLS